METFRRASRYFLEARGLPAEARRALVRRLLAEEPDVARELERLLANDSDASPFLEQPIGLGSIFRLARDRISGSGLPEVSDFHVVPERIGAYQVLGLIGAGGMGVVYRATQTRPQRDVAIKVLRPGAASAEMLRRFEHEADILGRLRHAGIAQVYEAGVAELCFGNGARASRPFLAMELLQGETLTVYADSRGLDLRQRLALFARVCDAVLHAHQNGVIHRDLKPGNIIVVHPPGSAESSAAQPKIVDFGIARVAEPGAATLTMAAGPARLVGTLMYMSPEQLFGDGEPVDTRSDIYGLGVILYELLAGRLPYDAADRSVPEIIRLRETCEPAPLRQVRPHVDEDIATIVHVALARERGRRYASVAELAADVRRYLDGYAITARPPSAWYQFRKLIARQRGIFAAAALAIVALVVGTSVALYELRLAQMAALQAAAAVRDAESARAEAEHTVDFLIETLTSADPDRLHRDVLVRDVLDGMAPRLAEDWVGAPRVEARLRGAIGRTYAALGALDAAREHLERALQLYRAEHGDDDARTVDSELELAAVLSSLGEVAEAGRLIEHGYAVRRAALGPDAAATLAALSDLGESAAKLMRFDDAIRMWRDVIAAGEPRLGASAQIVLETKDRLASLLVRMDARAEARRLFDDVLANLTESTWGAASLRTSAQRGFAMLAAAEGQFADALTHQHAVLDALRERLGPEHPDTLGATHDLARIFSRLERYEEAEQLFRTVLESASQTLGAAHPNTLKCSLNLAAALAGMERRGEARALAEDTLRAQRDVLGTDHIELSDTLLLLGRLAVDEGDPSGAESWYAEALRVLAMRLSASHPQVALARAKRAACLVDMSRFGEAESELLSAYAVLSKDNDPPSARVAPVIDALIGCYEGWDKPDEAATWRARREQPADKR